METSSEEICIRCKGTGSLLKDRMFERFKGVGLMLISFGGLALGFGFVAIAGLLLGVFITIAAQMKKCSACHGKGKIELKTQLEVLNEKN